MVLLDACAQYCSTGKALQCDNGSICSDAHIECSDDVCQCAKGYTSVDGMCFGKCIRMQTCA
jgi:hypothetical protein